MQPAGRRPPSTPLAEVIASLPKRFDDKKSSASALDSPFAHYEVSKSWRGLKLKLPVDGQLTKDQLSKRRSGENHIATVVNKTCAKLGVSVDGSELLASIKGNDRLRFRHLHQVQQWLNLANTLMSDTSLRGASSQHRAHVGRVVAYLAKRAGADQSAETAEALARAMTQELNTNPGRTDLGDIQRALEHGASDKDALAPDRFLSKAPAENKSSRGAAARPGAVTIHTPQGAASSSSSVSQPPEAQDAEHTAAILAKSARFGATQAEAELLLTTAKAQARQMQQPLADMLKIAGEALLSVHMARRGAVPTASQLTDHGKALHAPFLDALKAHRQRLAPEPPTPVPGKAVQVFAGGSWNPQSKG